jgi:hypothetical protein
MLHIDAPKKLFPGFSRNATMFGVGSGFRSHRASLMEQGIGSLQSALGQSALLDRHSRLLHTDATELQSTLPTRKQYHTDTIKLQGTFPNTVFDDPLFTSPHDVNILCVGSGDGSQQNAIATHGYPNVQATFYESEKDVCQVHRNAQEHIASLRKNCHTPPLFQIDATKLDRIFPHNHFAAVQWTFPHNGKSVHKHGWEEVRASNKEMIELFLLSASYVVEPNGMIYITLKKTEHYRKWHPTSEYLLQECGLVKLPQSTPFELLPGHRPSTTRAGVCNGRIPKADGAEVLTFVRVDSVLGIQHFPELNDEELLIHQQVA